MGLTRTLFKLASLLTSAKILSSGNPKRVAKHLVRRQTHEGVGKWLRRL